MFKTKYIRIEIKYYSGYEWSKTTYDHNNKWISYKDFNGIVIT
jgi:hypothetical protein